MGFFSTSLAPMDNARNCRPHSIHCWSPGKNSIWPRSFRISMQQNGALFASKNCPVINLDSGFKVLYVVQNQGRVGSYGRHGNIILASFGIRLKPDGQAPQPQRADITRSLSQLLPYVVIATAASALINPATFTWFKQDYYALALGGIMLSMGLQLSLADFSLIFKKPLPLLVGYIAQYILKPILGFFVVKAFSVPDMFAAGLVLTACVAGAQLSSYASYLSRGDVALSITLTSITTITSVFMTPLLTQLMIARVIPVDPFAMSISITQVVFLPVLIGVTLNTYYNHVVDKARHLLPLLAMVCTSLCIGSPLALNQTTIISKEGVRLLLPVVLFHTSAFCLGYWLAVLAPWRFDNKTSRTLSLCTGMQSSTLAMLLAVTFLGKSHAVPPACSVVVMAIMGLSLASFWGRVDTNL